MPYRTPQGTHYHMTEGCCGAMDPCSGEGLEPCSICCGAKAAGQGGDGADDGFVPITDTDAEQPMWAAEADDDYADYVPFRFEDDGSIEWPNRNRIDGAGGDGASPDEIWIVNLDGLGFDPGDDIPVWPDEIEFDEIGDDEYMPYVYDPQQGTLSWMTDGDGAGGEGDWGKAPSRDKMDGIANTLRNMPDWDGSTTPAPRPPALFDKVTEAMRRGGLVPQSLARRIRGAVSRSISIVATGARTVVGAAQARMPQSIDVPQVAKALAVGAWAMSGILVGTIGITATEGIRIAERNGHLRKGRFMPGDLLPIDIVCGAAIAVTTFMLPRALMTMRDTLIGIRNGLS